MTTKKNSNTGGARRRSGRKPAADPKKIITVYVEQSIVAANGGIDKVKIDIYSFLKKQAEFSKQN